MSIREGEWTKVADLRDYNLSTSELIGTPPPIYFHARAAREIRVTLSTDSNEINSQLSESEIYVKAQYLPSGLCKEDSLGNLFVGN